MKYLLVVVGSGARGMWPLLAFRAPVLSGHAACHARPRWATRSWAPPGRPCGR